LTSLRHEGHGEREGAVDLPPAFGRGHEAKGQRNELFRTVAVGNLKTGDNRIEKDADLWAQEATVDEDPVRSLTEALDGRGNWGLRRASIAAELTA